VTNALNIFALHSSSLHNFKNDHSTIDWPFETTLSVKLERLHEYVLPAVATLAGMIFAVKMGSLTGHGSLGALTLLLVGVACVAVCIWLRTKTWILVAMTWDLPGQVPVTDLPLGVRDMAVALVVGSFAVFYALKMLRLRASVDWIDFLIGAMFLYLVTVYIQHPVGLAAFGSERVGGRPYFDAMIAVFAYWVLSRAPVDARSLRKLPIYLLVGTGFQALGSLTTYVFPGSGAILGQLYTGFIPAELVIAATDNTSRLQGLSTGSNTGMRVLCSYFRPITLLSPLYFWRFCAASLCMIGVLLSGFRSSFITVLMYGVIGSYFRRRVQDIIILTLAGIVAVSVLGLGNGRIFTLPLSVQRALTIFPGNWDYIAKDDASNSTQWRLDMWRIVLTEDRYIQNRLLGDGYGFTRSELGIMQSEMLGGPGFVGAARQESFMVSGLFHSGPLSAIRYVGYIGLAIYTSLIILLAVRGWKIIRSTEHSDLFAPALFVGMPVVIAPFIFYFIAGAFQYNLPDTIFAAGLIKLMERGMPLWRKLPESANEGNLPSRQPGRKMEGRPLAPAYIRG